MDSIKLFAKTHLLPIISLIALNVVYFYPVLQGKVIPQDDIMHGVGIVKYIEDQREQSGEEPMWNNGLFSGMPGFQAGTYYYTNVFKYITYFFAYGLGISSSMYSIALLMLGFYFLLATQRVKPWLAFLGALAFGFSAFFIISMGAGHIAKVRTAAYIAPTIAGVLMAYQGRKWLGWGTVALAVGISIHSNHIQISYYMALLIVILVFTQLYFFIKEKKAQEWFTTSLGLLIAAIIGILPNISQLWTNYVYQKETMRGGISELSRNEEFKGGLDFEYAMGWSYGVSEALNLVIPNATGGGVAQTYEGTEIHDQYFPMLRNNFQQQGYSRKEAEKQADRTVASLFYWGDQTFVNGGYYIGAVVFFFFVLSFFVLEAKVYMAFTLAIAFSLMLGWGINFEGFNRFMFENLPLFNKFRVPSMAFVILFFAVPLQGFLALQKTLSGDLPLASLKKKLLQAFYVTGGFCLIFVLFGGLLFDFAGNNDENLAQQGIDLDVLMADRLYLLRMSALKTLLFAGLAFGTTYLYVINKLKFNYFVAALALFILVDQWSFNKQHVGSDDFVSKKEADRVLQASAANIQINQDKDGVYRVAHVGRSLTGDAFTSYHHLSLGGYHGAKLQRYQDLIDFHLSKGNQEVFNMLNTRYFISDNKPQFNPEANGSQWLVSKLITADNADDEIEKLNNFQSKNEAILPAESKGKFAGSYNPASATLTLKSHKANEVVYTFASNEKQFAVFSEIFYQGSGSDWQAYINGEPVDHSRVNYTLRGMELAPGNYDIVFTFAPPSYLKGELYSGIASALLLILVGLAFWMGLSPKKNS